MSEAVLEALEAGEAKFWAMFEEEVGPMGQRPQMYWNLLLGHGSHLAPLDLEELTYYQLFGAVVGSREAFGEGD